MKRNLIAYAILLFVGLQPCFGQNTVKTKNDIALVEIQQFKDIKAKADKGDVEAQCWLAICYYWGVYGCKIDDQQAKQLFQKVSKNANENSAAVQYSKGWCYEVGSGMTKNAAEALKWYRKAADQNFAPAQYALGYFYKGGLGGIAKNEAEAVKLYRKAADQKYALALYSLGASYANGTNGFPQDDNEAIKWMRKAVEQGYVTAREQLALCYRKGLHIQQDYEEAIKLYTLAETQKADAKYGIAWCYHDIANDYYVGRGRDKDYVEAVKWFRKAAELGNNNAKKMLPEVLAAQAKADKGDHIFAKIDANTSPKVLEAEAKNGNPDAQCWLAITYDNGLQGISSNEMKAKELYLKVARHSNADLASVQYCKGACWRYGYFGGNEDFDEGFKWNRKSAEQSFPPAQYVLGYCYYRGKGVEQDRKEAVNWYRKAAAQGYAMAQESLGGYYDAEGYYSEAQKWYRLAVEHGYPPKYITRNYEKFEDAIKKGNLDRVKELIKNGADVNYMDRNFGPPLFLAAAEGRIEIVQELVRSGAQINISPGIQSRDYRNISVLHVAARRGQLEMVKELIRLGADVKKDYYYNPGVANRENPKGKVEGLAVKYALDNDHVEVAKLLKKHGANGEIPIAAVKSGDIIMTIVNNDMKTFKEIIDKAKVNQDYNVSGSTFKEFEGTNGGQQTLLHFATKAGNLDMIKELVNMGADINARRTAFSSDYSPMRGETKSTLNGMTALHIAASDGKLKPEVLKCLLDLGADPRITCNFHDEKSKAHNKIAQANREADKRAAQSASNQALSGASEVKVPLVTGPMNYVSIQVSPMDIASSPEKKALLEAARKKGAYINAKGEYGNTPLHNAILMKDVEEVKLLISQGADIHAKNEFGESPLHIAVGWNRIEIMNFLISQGANVNAKKNYGRTPLHLAESVELAKILISKGADVNAKDEYGYTPLDLAKKNAEIAKYLEGIRAKSGKE